VLYSSFEKGAYSVGAGDRADRKFTSVGGTLKFAEIA